MYQATLRPPGHRPYRLFVLFIRLIVTGTAAIRTVCMVSDTIDHFCLTHSDILRWSWYISGKSWNDKSPAVIFTSLRGYVRYRIKLDTSLIQTACKMSSSHQSSNSGERFWIFEDLKKSPLKPFWNSLPEKSAGFGNPRSFCPKTAFSTQKYIEKHSGTDNRPPILAEVPGRAFSAH